ncbi:hypothetical protein [Nocardioides mangrovi]|uniref:Lipoprotein n=1 Tax=Nocardioides mangrovi TaxID=2874580 RepID=A0ABS7U898_9ACTN|nr:hypothetical protein [Nocardioides mangrovi]MBZ5737209.1 hypothetical protein [Nocardioides mangrovi]
MPGSQPDHRGPILFLVLLVIVALLVVAWGARDESAGGAAPAAHPAGRPSPSPASPSATAEPSAEATPRTKVRPKVFGRQTFLVAYYGSGQTPALGVLGESRPNVIDRRLRAAAQPFARHGYDVRHVYELIVTIADGSPGPDGDYSHDIPRSEVQRYLAAARRHDALLLLDLQPGRSDFLDVAKRWAWALKDPRVGLALDPEWRMGPHQVPARTVGQVRAREVNRTTAWLARMVRRHDLPQKLLVLHQFRRDMVEDIAQVRDRPDLAMVQHVDGFGTQRQKRATYHAVARPRQFTMGFKLFYDEDVRRMGPREVHALRPRVRFVSFQ